MGFFFSRPAPFRCGAMLIGLARMRFVGKTRRVVRRVGTAWAVRGKRLVGPAGCRASECGLVWAGKWTICFARRGVFCKAVGSRFVQRPRVFRFGTNSCIAGNVCRIHKTGPAAEISGKLTKFIRRILPKRCVRSPFGLPVRWSTKDFPAPECFRGKINLRCLLYSSPWPAETQANMVDIFRVTRFVKRLAKAVVAVLV